MNIETIINAPDVRGESAFSSEGVDKKYPANFENLPVNILIVDDEPKNLTVLESLLDDPSYRLVRAESADEALLALVGEEFALLILDIQMPIMTGIELAQMIKERKKTAQIPIIFLTAYYNDDLQVLEGYGSGAVDYLHKPVNAAILRSKVAVFAEMHRVNRENIMANGYLLAEVEQRRQAEEKLRELNDNLEQRVTERTVALRESQRFLHEAKQKAEAANKAKDDFIAALSHELRTPLTPVLMTATALEGDIALPQELREQLSMMRRNIELEAKLIDDLLDITTISRGKLILAPVITNIHTLLGHTDEIVRSDGQGKQARIILDLAADRHHALVDSTRIQQVFWNLIKNAIKFTPNGGIIIVKTKNDAAGRIVISVEDNGKGISTKSLPHIFNAFEQGDVTGQHSCGGLGLGLAISKAIMDAHGGTISAESAGKDRGATFIITLASDHAPVDSGMEPRIGKVATLEPATLRLLIVEDHATTRMVLAQLLTRSGYIVTTAGNIQDALAAYGAEIFDVVISDLGLPDGSGMDLMQEIQRIRPVPAIALSGYGMEEDVRRTKQAGFSAHLVKPVNVDQLRQTIDQVIPLNTP